MLSHSEVTVLAEKHQAYIYHDFVLELIQTVRERTIDECLDSALSCGNVIDVIAALNEKKHANGC